MKKLVIYGVGQLIALYLSIVIHLSFIHSSDYNYYDGLVCAALLSILVHSLFGLITFAINEVKI